MWGELEIYRPVFKRMHYPSLAEFKSSVCGVGYNMSLTLVIEQIFNAQPGCAFPEEMGKQTKIELTTGRTHKPKFGGLQAAPNMVTAEDHGAADQGAAEDHVPKARSSCRHNLTWLHHRSHPHVP